MRKGLELYIAFGNVRETITAGTFVHVKVLNFDVQKERISRMLENEWLFPSTVASSSAKIFETRFMACVQLTSKTKTYILCLWFLAS